MGKFNLSVYMITFLIYFLGIEFHSKLEDIVKYVDNEILTGTYVVQKYIGMFLKAYLKKKKKKL